MNISDYFLLVTYHPRFLGEIVNGRKRVHAWYISKLQTKQNVTIVFFWSNPSHTLSNKNEVGAKWPGKRSTMKNFKINLFKMKTNKSKGRSSERARRSHHWFRSVLIRRSGPPVSWMFDYQKKKTWGQLVPKFLFLAARTSILVAKNYI